MKETVLSLSCQFSTVWLGPRERVAQIRLERIGTLLGENNLHQQRHEVARRTTALRMIARSSELEARSHSC